MFLAHIQLLYHVLSINRAFGYLDTLVPWISINVRFDDALPMTRSNNEQGKPHGNEAIAWNLKKSEREMKIKFKDWSKLSKRNIFFNMLVI